MTDTTPPPLPTNPNGDDKIWIYLCHLCIFIGLPLLFPLIVFLAKKQDSPLTAEHAKEAFNFHLSLVIYAFVAVMLCFVFIGFILLPVIGIIAVLFPILACVKVSEGKFYRYPLTIRIL